MVLGFWLWVMGCKPYNLKTLKPQNLSILAKAKVESFLSIYKFQSF